MRAGKEQSNGVGRDLPWCHGQWFCKCHWDMNCWDCMWNWERSCHEGRGWRAWKGGLGQVPATQGSS